MSRYLLAALVTVGCIGDVSAQATRIEGVWRITERITPPGNPRAQGVQVIATNPQPGLIIFTRGYYSEVYLGGAARPTVAPARDALKLTDTEKIAKYEEWRPLTANAGTYTIEGSRLIRHPIVAKNVDVMTRDTRVPLEFKLEDANTLWLLPTAERSATEPRTKLTRVE